MKILHVLDHSLPLHSGYTFRSENILKCQQQIGMDVVVVTSPKHEESWKRESPAKEEINGITYYRTGALAGASFPFISEWNLIKKLQKRIVAVCKEEKPDVIHAHSPVLNAFAALGAAKKLKLPVVYEIRAFWEDAAVDHGTYREWGAKYRIVRFLETLACKKVSKILTICEGLRRDLVKRGINPEKIGMIPNAINPENFVPVSVSTEERQLYQLDGKFVIGFMGSFYHYEGLDLLLDAASALRTIIPNLKILLVGGGEMETSLKEQVVANQLEDVVVFTGRLPHDQMPLMYSMLDVLVLPRKPMRLTELVTPLKPLEAMCMQKLVVASDVGGHKELVRHNETGILFQAGNSDSLAEAVSAIYLRSDTWRSIPQTALLWVKKERNWKGNGTRYARIYDRLFS